MKKIVQHHGVISPFAVGKSLESIQKRIPNWPQLVRQNPEHTLGVILGDALNAFILSQFGDQPRAESIKYLRHFKNLALANYRFGAGNEIFSCEIYGEVFDLAPNRKTAFMSVDFWEQAYDACMLMRDMEGLRFLATVPVEVFLQSDSGATSSDLSYFRFMSHFFSGGMDTGKLLISAFEDAMKPQNNSVRTLHVEKVRIPILELMQAFVEGDNSKFNSELFSALESHKSYYGTKENSIAKPGWLSMRILAACAMAVDAKGFSIEVESDYIPKWLYMGEGIK